MTSSGIASEKREALFVSQQRKPDRRKVSFDGIITLLFAATIPAAMGAWFFAVRAPLWLDETNTFWGISAGFSKIWMREKPIALYSYFLWAWRSLFGSSELVLRIPSIVAMVLATYVLYRIALQFFDRDIASIVAVIFCLNPIVVFAAIDVRSYAFMILAVNSALWILLRWTKTNRMRDAIALGTLCGAIVYLKYISIIILPAFVLVWLLRRSDAWKRRQLAATLMIFSVMMVPVFAPYFGIYQTRHSHVFAEAPMMSDIVATFGTPELFCIFAVVTLLAAALGKLRTDQRSDWAAAILFLAFVPIFILYFVSASTSLHIFIERYRLVAIPGVALCWGLLVSAIRMRTLRLLFCMVVLGVTLQSIANQPKRGEHGYSWKDSLELAESESRKDHAPLLICSDLPESDDTPLSVLDDVYGNGLYAQLTYYKVSSPVVPLPRALNDAAQMQIRMFLADAIPSHRRFFFVGYGPSIPTLNWIAMMTKETYAVRNAGPTSGVLVIEFLPKGRLR